MWKPRVISYDLDEEKIKVYGQLSKDVITSFIGGRGIGVYLGYNHIPTDAAPRGPDNAIIFGTGPMTGIPIPSAGMATATYKSPITNMLTTSSVTGSFGVILRKINFDFFIIKKRAKKPSYLLIDDFGDLILKDASDIWRESISHTNHLLKEKYGKNSCILTIGEAAINGVVYSDLIVNGEDRFERGGLGVVFASKNLKALVIQETSNTREYDDKLKPLIRKVNRKIKKTHWSISLHNRGTFSIIFKAIEKKLLPTKNCTRILNLDSSKISSYRGYNSYYKCWYCPINCLKSSYQAFTSLGPNLKITNLETIQKVIEKVQQEGLDPLAAGAALASILHIQDDFRKLLDSPVPGRWGNERIFELIDQIILKEGLGDKLSRGEGYLYQLFDVPSPVIKHQLMGMFYYPNMLGLSLAAGIATTSGNILQTNYMIGPELLGIPLKLNPASSRAKVPVTIFFEDMVSVLDSLILCERFLFSLLRMKKSFSRIFPSTVQPFILDMFSPRILTRLFNLEPIPELLSVILEEKISLPSLLKVAERITITERLFNTRMGLTKEDDLFDPYVKKRPDFSKKQAELVDKYYQVKGFTEDGLVKKETIEELELHKLIKI